MATGPVPVVSTGPARSPLGHVAPGADRNGVPHRVGGAVEVLYVSADTGRRHRVVDDHRPCQPGPRRAVRARGDGPRRRRCDVMNGTRSARNVSAAVVAGIAAWSSYSHMVHVALRFGERPEVAYVLPFSVDGMLVVSATAMVDDKRSGRRVRPAARVAFTAGVLASIAANIAAAEPTAGA